MSTPHRIYLVDDDRFLCEMYAVKFKASGHDVTAFGGGEALLKALRESPVPDAILLDIVMPDMDGFQVLETVRREKLAPTTKIIVLSNQGQEADIEKATSLGAAGYIIKVSSSPSEVFAQTIKIIETTP